MARRLLHSVLTMTAAHTANVGGYDLQADMVADIMGAPSAQWYGTRTAELLLISGRYY